MKNLVRFIVLTLVLTACGDGRLSPQGGTITSVRGGSGLTGGGTGGAVTLNVGATAGGGLTVGADSIGLSTACASGEVLQWDGDSWECEVAGITMSVGANIIPKSDGANLVASGLTDDGTTFDVNRQFTKLGSTDGSVHINGGTTGSINFLMATDADADGWINRFGFGTSGTTRFRNLIIGDGKATAACTVTGSTKTLNCVGGLQVNGTNVNTFTTSNAIPKGNGSGLVASSWTDDGTTSATTGSLTVGANLTAGDADSDGPHTLRGGAVVRDSGTSTALGGHDAILKIFNSDSTANNWQAIVFGSTARASIEAKNVDQVNNYADLAFATRAADGYNARLYIQSAGNVCIGATSCSSKLSVTGTTSISGNATIGGTLTTNDVTAPSGSSIVFVTDGNTRVTIGADGSFSTAHGGNFGDSTNDTTTIAGTLDVNGTLAKFGNGSDGVVYITDNGISGEYATNDLGALYLGMRGYQNGTTQFRDVIFGDGKDTEACRIVGSTKTLTCIGGLATSDSGGLSIAGNATIGGTLGVTGLLTATAGVTTPGNLTTTGTGDLVSADDLFVADDATIGDDLIISTGAGVSPELFWKQSGQIDWKIYGVASSNTLNIWNSSAGTVIGLSTASIALAKDTTVSGQAILRQASPTKSQLLIDQSSSAAGVVSAGTFAADNSMVGFDLHYQSNWIARDTSVAGIYKNTDKLKFFKVSGTSNGATIPTGTINAALATPMAEFDLLSNSFTVNGIATFVSDVNLGDSTADIVTHAGTLRTVYREATPLAVGQNDYAGCDGALYCRISASTSGVFITGINAGGTSSTTARILIITNDVSSENIAFTHDDPSSLITNRIYTTDGNTATLARGGIAWFLYDGDLLRWRLIYNSSTALPTWCEYGMVPVFTGNSDSVQYECKWPEVNPIKNRVMVWNDDWEADYTGITGPMIVGNDWRNGFNGETVSWSSRHEPGRGGVLDLSIGVGTNGQYAQVYRGRETANFEDADWTFEATVKYPILSSTANSVATLYSSLIGFSDALGAGFGVDTNDGCYFAYDRGNRLAGNKNPGLVNAFECWCAKNGTRTGYLINSTGNSDNSFPLGNGTIVADTWYRLKIETLFQGAQVNFYIDDVKVCEIATNVPVGAGGGNNLHHPQMHIYSWATTGTGARSLYVDQTRLETRYPAARSP